MTDAARMFEEVNGFPAPDPATSDPLTGAAVDFVFGDVWTRPGLTRKERRWIALSCVAAAGAPVALEVHLGAALRSGDISVEELEEFCLQFAVYQGFPRATTLQAALRKVTATS